MSERFDIQQYRIQDEPFYQPTGNEVTLYEAAYAAR
ncbi:MAG: AAA family ATPase, partial [Methylobacterium sp.]|nr:AAA family ATPase [Methylobacterium sp.]